MIDFVRTVSAHWLAVGSADFRKKGFLFIYFYYFFSLYFLFCCCRVQRSVDERNMLPHVLLVRLLGSLWWLKLMAQMVKMVVVERGRTRVGHESETTRERSDKGTGFFPPPFSGCYAAWRQLEKGRISTALNVVSKCDCVKFCRTCLSRCADRFAACWQLPGPDVLHQNSGGVAKLRQDGNGSAHVDYASRSLIRICLAHLSLSLSLSSCFSLLLRGFQPECWSPPPKCKKTVLCREDCERVACDSKGFFFFSYRHTGVCCYPVPPVLPHVQNTLLGDMDGSLKSVHSAVCIRAFWWLAEKPIA